MRLAPQLNHDPPIIDDHHVERVGKVDQGDVFKTGLFHRVDQIGQHLEAVLLRFRRLLTPDPVPLLVADLLAFRLFLAFGGLRLVERIGLLDLFGIDDLPALNYGAQPASNRRRTDIHAGHNGHRFGQRNCIRLENPPAPADDQVSHRGIHRAERGCLGDLQHQLCREHPLEMHLFNVGELFNQALFHLFYADPEQIVPDLDPAAFDQLFIGIHRVPGDLDRFDLEKHGEREHRKDRQRNKHQQYVVEGLPACAPAPAPAPGSCRLRPTGGGTAHRSER